MRVHTKPLYDHILPKLVAVDNKPTLQIHICGAMFGETCLIETNRKLSDRVLPV